MQLNATVAERLVQGRILLCGDAAHQFPPTGGLGVNTGLQGMHNAMWKLARHVRGLADWSLVETYESERRPVSERITRQSFENSVNVARIRAAIAEGTEALPPDQLAVEARRYGNHLGAEFHLRLPRRHRRRHQPTAGRRRLRRLPPLRHTGRPRTPPLARPRRQPLLDLDLVGTGFTLLIGPNGQAWRAAAHEASEQTGVPVDHYLVDAAGL